MPSASNECNGSRPILEISHPAKLRDIETAPKRLEKFSKHIRSADRITSTVISRGSFVPTSSGRFWQLPARAVPKARPRATVREEDKT